MQSPIGTLRVVAVLALCGAASACVHGACDEAPGDVGPRTDAADHPIPSTDAAREAAVADAPGEDATGQDAGGVEYDWKGVVWNPDPDNTSRDLDQIQGAGIRWARIWLGEGTPMARIEDLVTQARSAGFQIIFVYAKNNPSCDYGTPDQEAQNAAWIGGVVAQFRSSVHVWEVHNEANLGTASGPSCQWNLGSDYQGCSPTCWAGEGSSDAASPYNQGVHRYVQHLQNTYNAIKAADPTAVVVSGGLSSWDYVPFLDRLTAERAYLYFDEFGFHPYGDSPAASVRVLAAAQAQIAAWPAPYNHKAIWITEIGFQTTFGSSQIGYAVSEAAKAQDLTDVMTGLRGQLTQRRPIFWYILHEDNPQPDGYGLLAGGTPLPAYAAYQALSN